jgi:probable biosynthetic protein (TIGR04098 family)
MPTELSNKSSLSRPVSNLRLIGNTTVVRTEMVNASMCGQNSLFCGRIGDWTWDAVSALCGIQVLNAQNSLGQHTYLSFYYYHLSGGRLFHLHTPAFGDLLHITSTVFGFGSESVLTLHRITRTPAGHDPDPTMLDAPVDPEEFYSSRAPNCLYVENFNRWITRGSSEGNSNLLSSSPLGFDHSHLPTLPRKYSPRIAYHDARTHQTFLPQGREGFSPLREPVELEYLVDASRDLNGVSLLYFASYFSIVDWAVLQFWHSLGRTDADFLSREVLNQKLCYLGNADTDTIIAIDLQGFARDSDPAEQYVDVVLREADTRRVLAVCTLHLRGRG